MAGGMCGRGYMVGGMCDRGACVAGGMHGSERYASYWNAFLFWNEIFISIKSVSLST